MGTTSAWALVAVAAIGLAWLAIEVLASVWMTRGRRVRSARVFCPARRSDGAVSYLVHPDTGELVEIVSCGLRAPGTRCSGACAPQLEIAAQREP